MAGTVLTVIFLVRVLTSEDGVAGDTAAEKAMRLAAMAGKRVILSFAYAVADEWFERRR
jgi:hypothetical protein